MLYIFSGLPGVGKTELAKLLAKKEAAVYLRIDSIEQSMKDSGIKNIYDEGYQIAFSLAAENLRLGLSVVADSTNPVEVSRKSWRNVALSVGLPYLEIEIICSNLSEHRKRIEQRQSDIANLKLPSWKGVVDREYEPWKSNRLILDTAGRSIKESQHELENILVQNVAHALKN